MAAAQQVTRVFEVPANVQGHTWRWDAAANARMEEAYLELENSGMEVQRYLRGGAVGDPVPIQEVRVFSCEFSVAFLDS